MTAVGWLLVAVVPAVGQGVVPPPLRMEGLVPVGGRATATESWGTFGFAVENRSATARDARVLVFYPERPDQQYARDLWVPVGARLTGWVPVGPAPKQPSELSREIKFHLYDRTGQGSQPLLPPDGDRLRNRAVPYRPRLPTTAVLLDTSPEEPGGEDGSTARRVIEFVRTFRLTRGLDESLSLVTDSFLPPAVEALDGVDQVVLAGNRLATDPPGLAALRRWVSQGGTLWVLLDRIEPQTLAPILGDEFDVQVVGRTGLTRLRLARPGDEPPDPRELEQPVELVRVALAGGETIHFEADGWPAAFSRPLGLGRVVVTTLGGPGWHRPRVVSRGPGPGPVGPRPFGPGPAGPRPLGGDPPSPFEHAPDLPVPLPPLERLAAVLFPEPTSGGLRPDDFGPLLAAEIGYQVLDQRTAAVVLGGFVVALIGLGAGLRWAGRPAAVGLLGPAAAVVAAGLFVALGSATRRAVPPTAGAAGLVAVVPGTGEGAAVGLAAVYRPDSGPTRLGGEGGGRVDPDPAGLDGQPRRRVQTDLSAWHIEGLDLPAGVRLGPIQTSLPIGSVAAVARFGPDGIVGRLSTGRLADPSDAVLLTPAVEPVAVRVESGGVFVAAPDGGLPAGQYLAGAVLTDRQQRRQAVYRRLLTPPQAQPVAGRELLLVWASVPPPFTFGEETRTVGEWLVAVPLRFEPPAVGTRVTVPRGVVPCWWVVQGRPRPVPAEGGQAADLRLRFELPPALRGLVVERATVSARVTAPGRRVALTGGADAVLHEAVGPLDPIRVEVTDPRLLRPDAAGGLPFGLSLGERGEGGAGNPWRIDGLGIELVGRVER